MPAMPCLLEGKNHVHRGQARANEQDVVIRRLRNHGALFPDSGNIPRAAKKRMAAGQRIAWRKVAQRQHDVTDVLGVAV